LDDLLEPSVLYLAVHILITWI